MFMAAVDQVMPVAAKQGIAQMLPMLTKSIFADVNLFRRGPTR